MRCLEGLESGLGPSRRTDGDLRLFRRERQQKLHLSRSVSSDLYHSGDALQGALKVSVEMVLALP